MALFGDIDTMPATIEFHPDLIDAHCLIDVRSPLEYEEDHLPGAYNVPLLSNEQRAEIGTIYKQQGPQIARVRGLEITAPHFSTMVAEIAKIAAGKPIVVYCWRGGLRSKTVASILELTGYPVHQLQGGYKTFRTGVTAYFENFTPPGPLVVLHGNTGTGKTDFLHILATKGFTIVDLEGLACHRGSAFGEVGLTQSLSQKTFETTLWNILRQIPADTPIIIEGESKRIGKVSLPGNMYEVMRQSVKVWCQASLDTRVQRLIEDYGKPEFYDELAAALSRITKKLGGEKSAEIRAYLEAGTMEPFMRELMVSYYDRNYYRTRDWVEDLTLSLEDYQEAAQELARFLASCVPLQPITSSAYPAPQI